MESGVQNCSFDRFITILQGNGNFQLVALFSNKTIYVLSLGKNFLQSFFFFMGARREF